MITFCKLCAAETSASTESVAVQSVPSTNSIEPEDAEDMKKSKDCVCYLQLSIVEMVWRKLCDEFLTVSWSTPTAFFDGTVFLHSYDFVTIQ